MPKIKKQFKIGGGLQRLPDDARDFIHEKIFGSLSPVFPESLFVSAPLKIKDQENTDFCTAYTVTSVSEDQEGVELNPQYTFKSTRLIDKKPIDSYGANLRDACKSICKYGSIEQDYYPFPDKDQNKDRNFIADPKNWSQDFERFAWEHAKNSFFRVDKGSFDTFDNLRMALMMNKDAQRSIATGSDWYDSWTRAERGIISEKDPEGNIGGHAFKLFGFLSIDGTEYLVAQLSNGTEIGDKGVFYFPRRIVNKYFTYGAFMFNDMPRDTAMVYNEAGIKVTDGIFTRMFKTFTSIIKNLL